MQDRTPSSARGEEPDRHESSRLRFLTAIALFVVSWERQWPRFWPVLAVIGSFAALVLLDVLPMLPGWAHIVVLVAFACAFVVTLIRFLSGFGVARRTEGLRRLEHDSELRHRPLTSLEDKLGAGVSNRETRRLWQVHRKRLAAQIRRVRVRMPAAGLARVDPLALRSVLGLVLVIGLVVGGLDSVARLERALVPNLGGAAAAEMALDAWINPPPYTGVPPRFLDPTASEPLEVPAGSRFLAQVQGVDGVPELVVGKDRASFETVARSTYKIEHELQSGDRLELVEDERTLAAWPLRIVPDMPPTVAFTAPPQKTDRSTLRLQYEAEDDYRVARVRAEIRRIDRPEADPIELELVVPSSENEKKTEAASYHDFTPHPWAGIAVEIQLTAFDEAGQKSRSDTARTVLPERIFNHPVARALVELRRRLTLHPEERLPVVQHLDELGGQPAHYFYDSLVSLAIHSASRRLVYDQRDEAIPAVQQILWDTALYIEEGELAIAERDLRRLQEALMEALDSDAPQEEIERLMSELEAALDEYMKALAEKLQKDLAEGKQPQQMPPNAEMMNSQDLQRMLDKARELSRSGAREAARELLARLQQMLENLQANPYAQMMNQDMQDAHDMMQDLEDIISNQQELLDRSYQRSMQDGQQQQGQQGQQQQANQGDAASQEALRRALGKLMRQLGDATGEIPAPLGRAEQEMRSARDALGQNQPGEAVQPQTRSLDQLQQGMQAMAEGLMRMLEGQPDQGRGTVGAQPGYGRDPFGREINEGFQEAIEGVEIPEEMELRRSREILDELRRRRSDRSRPEFELDYIDRLLQQF